MAGSRFRGAVDRLRRHARDVMSDGDFAKSDQLLLDVLGSLGNNDPDDGEDQEAQGLEPSMATRTGYDWRGAVGLDHLALDARALPKRAPSSLKRILKDGCPPLANEVR